MPARYALAGAGHRAQLYVRAILGPHSEAAQLVAICEPNPVRAAHYRDEVTAAGHPAPSLWTPDDLEPLIERERIDRVIVAARDDRHADLVVRSLDAGADVVVEKPLTTDADGARAIADAVARTGREVVTTFNYRYSPRNGALRRLIAEGAIGEVTSIDFSWLLDTAHGADYFRRWHRRKENSGGLLVHKSGHHFDLVNWWLGDSPRRVFAAGGLRFYGERSARARGLGVRPLRGTHEGAHDRFELDLRDDPRLRALYLEAESHDSYLRDLDVFGPGITIEDNLALTVEYAGGAVLSYSLNAHSPWEGYRVAVNGTAGRAELEVVERSAVLPGDGLHPVIDPSAVAADTPGTPVRPSGDRLLVQRHWEQAREVPITASGGGHGGGDAILLRDVFEGVQDDPLGRAAGWRDGVRALAVGIAGNRSLHTHQAVDIEELGLPLDADGAARTGDA
ncbi:MAG: Gfo/Idh/MocA family oxidoreductase [Microbacteriaceae bacterium]